MENIIMGGCKQVLSKCKLTLFIKGIAKFEGTEYWIATQYSIILIHKKGIIMKTFMMILLTILVTVNGVSDVIITEENIQEYISSDCESVANFIVDNLQLFAQEYNNQLED